MPANESCGDMSQLRPRSVTTWPSRTLRDRRPLRVQVREVMTYQAGTNFIPRVVYHSHLIGAVNKDSSPISIQIHLCVAPYGHNQADGAMITARRWVVGTN